MSARVSALAFALAAVASLRGAGAQSPRTFSFRADNDAFDFWMAPWNRPDDEYTSGVHLTYDGGDSPWWSRPVLRALPGCSAHAGACRTTRFEIGQDIYTPPAPADGGPPAPGARPNAGWLYVSEAARALRPNRLDALTLVAGVTGRPSLAQWTQHLAHDVGPAYNRPTDWSRQIAFEPGVDVRYEHDARVAKAAGAPFAAELVPRVAASLGNVRTDAELGARIRFGWRMPHPWLPDAKGAGIALMAGLSARAVARDLFLDGNTFQGGPRVGHEPFVGSGEVGLELHARGITLGYRAVSDSRAYRGGPAWHPWGSLTGSVTWDR